MLNDAVLTHPLLAPVGVDALLARHPWNPQNNDTPVVHKPRGLPGERPGEGPGEGLPGEGLPGEGPGELPACSIFINGNSRVEQRTRLADDDAIEFRPYPATVEDLAAMEALVGARATVYVLYKGQGRQGVALVSRKPHEQGVYVLRLQKKQRPQNKTHKVAWADME